PQEARMSEVLTLGPLETASPHARDQSEAHPVARHITTLAVENMHCGGCIRSVERALSQLPDVVSVRANLSQRRVTIETQTEVLIEEPYIAALAASGFKATALADE